MGLRTVFLFLSSLTMCSSTRSFSPVELQARLSSNDDRAAPDVLEGAAASDAAAADSSPPSGASSSPASDDATACPTEMVLVVGQYCPKVRQTCARWVDPPGPYREFRCAEYVQPATCLAAREKKRFCIDREEMVPPGETVPIVDLSFTTATELCTSLGKRLCLESEWQFACEGEAMHPYPYGSGFVRDKTACNIDRTDLGKPQSGLRDLRAPITAYPRCMSVFGVHDMSGNVEEWTALDGVSPPRDRSAMKGAWWLPGKNTCRAATLNHGEIYRGPQVGARCCRDAASPPGE